MAKPRSARSTICSSTATSRRASTMTASTTTTSSSSSILATTRFCTDTGRWYNQTGSHRQLEKRARARDSGRDAGYKRGPWPWRGGFRGGRDIKAGKAGGGAEYPEGRECSEIGYACAMCGVEIGGRCAKCGCEIGYECEMCGSELGCGRGSAMCDSEIA
eukprot:2260263-Rhodomonas_salina.1